jgi:hypothetical protein
MDSDGTVDSYCPVPIAKLPTPICGSCLIGVLFYNYPPTQLVIFRNATISFKYVTIYQSYRPFSFLPRDQPHKPCRNSAFISARTAQIAAADLQRPAFYCLILGVLLPSYGPIMIERVLTEDRSSDRAG